MTRTRNIRKTSYRISESQGRLPFNRPQNGGILAFAYPIERKLIGILGISFVVLSILYIYFMISSVTHVAARRELAKVASEKAAKVADLETAYLAQTNGITDSYAKSLGYVAVQEKYFAERGSVVSIHTTQ
jgi:hypothetical protein